MGCCTSYSKSRRPIKASIIQQNTSRAELLEEEKNPDLYRQSSAMQNSQLLQEPNPTPMKLLEPSPGPNTVSNTPSRQASGFNLNKDLIESMRKERTKSMTMVLENGGQIDESVYKLTKEQHQMIYDFVEDRTKMMKEAIMRLNAHLCTNDKEVEELALIIEDLRTSEKDIVNCVEDLRSFSVRNEEEYYKRLEKDCQFAKNLITEYRTYQNGLCNFQDMKSQIAKILATNNIKPVDKVPAAADPVEEKTVIEPIFQPPVENVQEPFKEEKKSEPETPQTFHITTVFEEVEGQAVEPKPMNNELEPLQEEHKDETEIQEQEEASPLPHKGMIGKLPLDGKVVLEKTVDEGKNSDLKSRSNYLMHNEGILKGIPTEEKEAESPTITKKYVDLFEAIQNSENLKTETAEKEGIKPPVEEKVKKVRKSRPQTKKREENGNVNNEDVMDSRSDLESIGVDFKGSERDFENLSVKSLRSKKAVEVYNIEFDKAQGQVGGVKQITKKINRVQTKEKEKIEL